MRSQDGLQDLILRRLDNRFLVLQRLYETSPVDLATGCCASLARLCGLRIEQRTSRAYDDEGLSGLLISRDVQRRTRLTHSFGPR